jgi:hypothetical protein
MFVVTDNDISTKTQLVAALRKFLVTGKTTVPPDNGRDYHASPGELVLVHAIADYYEYNDAIPDKVLGIGVFHDLRKHLAEAFHAFRTEPKYDVVREAYKRETGESDEIPDLFDARGRWTRHRVVYDLCRLMPLIAGRMGGVWLERDLEGYFECQVHVVEAAWREFVRRCYREIAPVIKASGSTSRRGLFGRTYLNADAMAGRVQYTFERMTSEPDLKILDQLTALAENRDATVENKYAAIEALLMTRRAPKETWGRYEISFAADESDLLGMRSGMNFPGSSITDYKSCVDMIEDVVAHWDLSKLVEGRY